MAYAYFYTARTLCSIETLNERKQIHNDIKPQNYLVKFLKNENDLTDIEIVLTDFGLAGPDSKGGTPIFASPESLANSNRKTSLTDVFSLGRLFLFLSLSKENYLEFLYVPLDKEKKKNIMKVIEKEPFLDLVSKMMRIKNRITVPEIRAKLKLISQVKNQLAIAEMTKIVADSKSEYTTQYIDNLKHFS